MSIATNKIIHQALAIVRPRFRLPIDHGLHGIKHWVRVWANAEMLCAYYGVDPAVPCWFAFLHDSCRENEGYDPDHGHRASRLVQSLGGDIDLSEDDRYRLRVAMQRHSEGGTTYPDIKVRICWDADRLDLGRVGIVPDPNRLCTDYARCADVIDAAFSRSVGAPRGAMYRQRFNDAMHRARK